MQLDGYEDVLAKLFSERIMAYNRNWADIDRMLDVITSEKYRNQYKDSNGNGWKYTWFVMDHPDYKDNQRNKITGFNAIWDHYMEYYDRVKCQDDEFQWHAHPANVYSIGNKCGVSYWNSPHILQSLSRRLIDRGFFPSGFRAGYHTERSDSHWFLEQYIPYDFSNQAISETEDEKKQKDVSDGRFGDWRRARSDWGWYHPSHDDYQSEGNCHRVIFRCLNAGTRLRLISKNEIDHAFMRAESGKDTLLAFCDHDFRDMSYDIDEVYNYITAVSKKYPSVEWINSTAVQAAKKVMKGEIKEIHIEHDLRIMEDGRMKLSIKTDIDSFGTQPFFAIKTIGGSYIAEQLDVQVPNRQWSYVFDDDSIHPIDVSCIGIATNSRFASGALKVLSKDDKVIFDTIW